MGEILKVIGFLALGSVLCSLALGIPPLMGLSVTIFALIPLGLIILAPLIAVGAKVESRIVKHTVATLVGALATYIGFGVSAWLTP